MGLFKTAYNSEEKRVLESHIDECITSGMTRGEARNNVKFILDLAIKKSKSTILYDIPPGVLGDLINGDSESNNEDLVAIAQKISDSIQEYQEEYNITEGDIKVWWDLSQVERSYIIIEDEFFRVAALKALREQNNDDINIAVAEIRRSFAIFGDPNDESHVSGDDRPLPFELKLRINDFINSSKFTQGSSFLKPKTKTMNAFMREKIRSGDL